MQFHRRKLLVTGAAGLLMMLIRCVGAQSSEKVVSVVARKFVFLPNRITVRRGEPLVIEFTAPEVTMGFSIPALKLRTDIVPGQVARLRFVPEQEGTFDFLCDIFCGDGHEGMSGQLIVVA